MGADRHRKQAGKGIVRVVGEKLGNNFTTDFIQRHSHHMSVGKVMGTVLGDLSHVSTFWPPQFCFGQFLVWAASYQPHRFCNESMHERTCALYFPW